MNRREFITLLGGATAWPLAARAQQPERMRRIGLLMAVADNREGQARVTALKQGLQELGWTEGRNIQIETRFGRGDADRLRAHAAELVAFAPDVVVGNGTPGTRALRQATSSIPIVMVGANDPVEQGLVSSLAHPGGNITGFALIDFQTAAPVRDTAEIEESVAKLGREAGGGLIIPPDAATIVHHQMIIRLAQQHRLPAVYSFRPYVAEGALMSYGSNPYDHFRRSASYVDRILNGAKPADLPVQQPTKFELAINLKTAKALGPPTTDNPRATAAAVIERSDASSLRCSAARPPPCPV